jgi:hypothetical protein
MGQLLLLEPDSVTGFAGIDGHRILVRERVLNQVHATERADELRLAATLPE